MYGIPPQNPDTFCPNCRRVMVELSRYASGDYYVDDTEASLFPAGIRPSIGFALFNLAWEFAAYHWRKARLLSKSRSILPAYPNSLICPACQTILRRA